MKKEDIEKAAKKQLKGIVPCEWNQEPFIDIFIKASEWRINSVWHDANIPLNNEDLLLVEENSGVFGLCFEFSPENTKRWAYVRDLIPGKEQ